MGEKKNIVWLASYPKSGNTWFRVFLSNLLEEKEEPAHINELSYTPIASARTPFDEATGIPSADLTHDEIDNLRPEVYKYMANNSDELQFRKVHDAYTYLPDGRPLFPPEVSRSAVYFIRNPLDVAISFAHHSAREPQRMIEVLNNPEYAFCSKTTRLFNQFRQKLGDWSFHVKSWTEQQDIPVLVLRYEDMKKTTFATFKKAVAFLQLDKTDAEIQKALDYSDLSVLQEQEKESGFKEKMIKADSFFRKGSVGEWKEVFNKEEIRQIIENHRAILKRFDYLSNKGEILFEPHKTHKGT